MNDVEQVQILESNKREMFDAMRAYHVSEVEHKRDAITLLTTLLASIGAVFAALVVPDNPGPFVGVLALLSAAAASLGAFVIVSSTSRKIEADHAVYKDFGAEYVRTSDALGLYVPQPLPGGGSVQIKQSRSIGQGRGYEKTLQILRAVGVTIAVLSWLATAFVWLAVCPRTSGCAIAQAAPAASAPRR